MDTFTGSTTDDLLRRVLQRLISTGARTVASRGEALEIVGAALELTNPRARLSRSEARGRIYSGLGEFCWYLSGSNMTSMIVYYLPAYVNEDEEGIVHGGYGRRIFHWDGKDQLASIISLLRDRPSSRQAVIQIFDRNDIENNHKDIPCTCTIQFLIRNERLTMITHMRSNDAYVGLPHDVFCFTMLQELIARTLDIELGSYVHFVGSLHLYERNIQDAKKFLKEGWQSTAPMPSMPPSDPWLSVAQLRAAEERIRLSEQPAEATLPSDPYWSDLAKLLMIYRMSRSGITTSIDAIRASMSTNIFDIYILSRLDRMSQ